MESSFTFIRVRGIPIGAHWSWVLVFALVAWSLTGALFPETFPGLSETTYLVMGVFTAVLLFASILLHELGHAFQALKEDMEIEGITLWLFGGVARFRGMFPSAGAEFRIASAGPVVSVLLAVFFWLLSQVGLPEAADGVFAYLARINAILVAFNLVPALPLDGGRILRAWLWRRQGNFAAATISAARAGKVFGGLLAAVGLLNVFSGGQTGGLWFLFLGWFLVQAAGSEATAAMVQRSLGSLRVRDLMTPDPATAEADLSIETFFNQVVQGRGHSAYPVLQDDRVVGMVSLRQAGEVPVPDRQLRRVSDVMLPLAQLPVLRPDQEAISALESVQPPSSRALVLEEDRLRGIVSVSDVARAVQTAEARATGSDGQGARRAGAAVWLIVGLLMTLAAGALYHPPLVVLQPGPTVDVLEEVELEGVETQEVNGRYLLTSVRLSQPSALRTAWAALTGAEIYSQEQIVPEGADPDSYARQQREIFRESQEVAAAAAATAAGLEVAVTGDGAEVNDVVPGAPADGLLSPGDVIVSIDGAEVTLATDLPEAIRARPAGTDFDLEVERDGDVRVLQVTSERLTGVAEPAVAIGVLVSTRNFEVELPFEVDFPDRDIGGPSAGLAFAVALTDLLDEEDLAKGRTIAVTGTVDGEGRVGVVGAVEQKARGALEADADVFLVPQAEVGDATVEGLTVRGVSTLQDALSALDRDA